MEFFICAILSMYFIPIILSRSTPNVIPSNFNYVVPHESFNLVCNASVLYFLLISKLPVFYQNSFLILICLRKCQAPVMYLQERYLVHLEKQRHHMHIVKISVVHYQF